MPWIPENNLHALKALLPRYAGQRSVQALIDQVWAEEASRRARACDEGRMKTIPFEDVFVNK